MQAAWFQPPPWSVSSVSLPFPIVPWWRVGPHDDSLLTETAVPSPLASSVAAPVAHSWPLPCGHRADLHAMSPTKGTHSVKADHRGDLIGDRQHFSSIMRLLFNFFFGKPEEIKCNICHVLWQSFRVAYGSLHWKSLVFWRLLEGRRYPSRVCW